MKFVLVRISVWKTIKFLTLRKKTYIIEATLLRSFVYRVHHNYGNKGLMERYKFNSLSAIKVKSVH